MRRQSWFFGHASRLFVNPSVTTKHRNQTQSLLYYWNKISCSSFRIYFRYVIFLPLQSFFSRAFVNTILSFFSVLIPCWSRAYPVHHFRELINVIMIFHVRSFSELFHTMFLIVREHLVDFGCQNNRKSFAHCLSGPFKSTYAFSHLLSL